MATEKNINVVIGDESPFTAGQTVKHKCDEVGEVATCRKRFTNDGRIRWVVYVNQTNPMRAVQWFADNCQLVSDRPEWPKYFEPADNRGPEYRRRFNAPMSYAVWCDGVGVPDQTYEQAIKAVADGILVEVDENGVEIGKRMEPEEKTPGVTFEPTVETRDDVSAALNVLIGSIKPGDTLTITKHSTANDNEKLEQTKDEPTVEEAVDNLLVANLVSSLMRTFKFFAGSSDKLRDEFEAVVRKELGEHPLMPVSQHKATDDVRKEHIETLRAKVAELEERSKEANAELVRSAQTAAEWKAKAENAAAEFKAAFAERGRQLHAGIMHAAQLTGTNVMLRNLIDDIGDELGNLQDEKSVVEGPERWGAIEGLRERIKAVDQNLGKVSV